MTDHGTFLQDQTMIIVLIMHKCSYTILHKWKTQINTMNDDQFQESE